MNALSIVEREAPGPGEADWETARRIRAGDVREGDLAALKAGVEAKLRLASPKYLERYREPACSRTPRHPLDDDGGPLGAVPA